MKKFVLTTLTSCVPVSVIFIKAQALKSWLRREKQEGLGFLEVLFLILLLNRNSKQ